ncbi:SDR family NAD(P)-dependent oxidoreductase [Aurantiacibacter luteus]|uniref:Short-chain dehydrogenase n=1 Tax=Aurantiacibacter luteus TaxID=1581420 RepID=A0A0G9MV93_9SPHN|nr:SDR family NAD(P)-dependent oxidoreductase [Aurantiacibacter luteus]KLE34636.1 hypothetical protein AAW00_10680 [Aurantiacibacter luteus]
MLSDKLDDPPPRSLIVGNSGGIGAAFERQLRARGMLVTGLSRSLPTSSHQMSVDLSREHTIETAAVQLRDQAPFSLILVCTGLLHNENLKPEKALRELDQDNLMQLFAVNAVGPALVAKHFIPLLPKSGRCIFAALSARVGSIGDNRLGGWHGYRASKAALNMLIKTISIELARTRPEAICVGLHPGTVDTDLSKPFQRAVPSDRLFSAETSAAHLLTVLDNLDPTDTGHCFAWDGTEIAP